MNEDDVIEVFVRHHARLVDHHVLLDNGSIDRTVEILKKLAEASLRLTVFSNRTPISGETAFDTFLYRHAIGEQQADGVFFLDPDEFLDLPRIGIGLRKRLADLNAGAVGLSAGESGERAYRETRPARKSSSQPAVLRLSRREALPGARRIRFCAMCLMVQKLPEACSFRTRHSSSRNTMSKAQWRLFSIAQWLRAIGDVRGVLVADEG
ncbi:MAG: glycosyltransferase family 2 protein [Acetobacteraceae bacterium]